MLKFRTTHLFKTQVKTGTGLCNIDQISGHGSYPWKDDQSKHFKHAFLSFTVCVVTTLCLCGEVYIL